MIAPFQLEDGDGMIFIKTGVTMEVFPLKPVKLFKTCAKVRIRDYDFRGVDSIILTQNQVEALRDQLTKILEEYED